MMTPSPRLREYIEAAKRAQRRAYSEENPHAKQILQEIERSYYRLVVGRWVKLFTLPTQLTRQAAATVQEAREEQRAAEEQRGT